MDDMVDVNNVQCLNMGIWMIAHVFYGEIIGMNEKMFNKINKIALSLYSLTHLIKAFIAKKVIRMQRKQFLRLIILVC